MHFLNKCIFEMRIHKSHARMAGFAGIDLHHRPHWSTAARLARFTDPGMTRCMRLVIIQICSQLTSRAWPKQSLFPIGQKDHATPTDSGVVSLSHCTLASSVAHA
jgi:hypothetical protein